MICFKKIKYSLNFYEIGSIVLKKFTWNNWESARDNLIYPIYINIHKAKNWDSLKTHIKCEFIVGSVNLHFIKIPKTPLVYIYIILHELKPDIPLKHR